MTVLTPRNILAAVGFAFFVAFAPHAPAGAAEAELGPAVGAKIPHDLSSTDAAGARRAFDDLAGPNGLVVFFVRSVDWCPYCKAQALSVDASRKEFAARGLGVAFISYDPVAKLAAFSNSRDLGLTLLSDPGSVIIDAFGLRNERHTQGRFAGIPHPAAFVIRPDRTVAAKVYETDYLTNDKSYVTRPEVGAILAAADAALGGAAKTASQ